MTSENFIKLLQEGRRDRTTEQIISEVTEQQIIFTEELELKRKEFREELAAKIDFVKN
jgi:hypothetical protein